MTAQITFSVTHAEAAESWTFKIGPDARAGQRPLGVIVTKYWNPNVPASAAHLMRLQRHGEQGNLRMGLETGAGDWSSGACRAPSGLKHDRRYSL